MEEAPLPKTKGRGHQQFHDQREGHPTRPDTKPQCQNQARQPANHHDGGEQGEGARLALDGGNQRPEAKPDPQQQAAEIGSVGQGLQRASKSQGRGIEGAGQPGRHGHQPGNGDAGLEGDFLVQGTSFPIQLGSAKAAAWTSGL